MNICTFRVKFIENRADLCKTRKNRGNPGFEKIETWKNQKTGFLKTRLDQNILF